MKATAVLPAILLVATMAALGQVSSTRSLALTGQDSKVAVVPAGVISTPLTFTADPTSLGGDWFDILPGDPTVPISLVRADGVEITQTNAAIYGYDYVVIPDGSLQSIPVGSLMESGTHVVIRLGQNQPPGPYQVKIDARLLVEDTFVRALYYSSSNVHAGITTADAQYAVGDTVVLAGLVFDGAYPIPNAAFTTWVVKPLTLNAQTTLGGFRLISQTDIDSQTTEYTYTATIANRGNAAKSVTAALLDPDPSIELVTSTVYFGDLPAGGLTTSITTLVIRAPKGQQIDPGTFQWNVTAPADPVSVTLADSGDYDDAPGDGLYSGAYVPDTPGDYLAGMSVTGTSLSGVPFSRSAVTPFTVVPPLAQITSFQDALRDDTGGGKFDRLVETTTIAVQTAGQYRLSLELVASNGQTVAAGTQVTLGTGTQSVDLSFSVADLLRLGVDGPYERENISG